MLPRVFLSLLLVFLSASIIAHCAVAWAGGFDNSQWDSLDEVGFGAMVERWHQANNQFVFLWEMKLVSKKSFLSCIAADANHALPTTRRDSFSRREDQVRFWKDGWSCVLAKVRWSLSCCAAARVPHGLERRVVALPYIGDKLCATTRVATLETPRHCRRTIGSLQSEHTW